ncbi:D-lactaldehyde dehydrogenase [Dacryopinax primogenitus]|uniref:D-lactaldehyde dehydrogenase n=1 Tax=Dacryopinax primogenitus (strain DJM 731) TaxID=1858805 RepID=M5G796_DACPD|nr:D-lactaldehyde dehydrogenase [Dacryopinax primogenitus]EJT99637.1 D-lactaldehyde dehydrogenase [Dacryopinax primogenitus]
MPGVLPPALVLVTGASGFLAAHVCQVLLERGYKVRGTVRTEEKAHYLLSLFSSPNFSYILVPDIQAPTAFDQAVKGVDAVLHTASPFHSRAVEPEEVIGPAVEGTRGVLESVQKINPSIKRIVITSSIASIRMPCTPGTVFTESTWNTHSPDVVAREGVNAPGIDKYRTSKVFAEKVAWEFVQTEKPSWDLVTICPPMIFGPLIHGVSAVENLNTSTAALRDGFTAEGAKTGTEAGKQAGTWVDVRDVALVHVEALAQDRAGGQRYISAAGPYSWQMLYDSVHALGKVEGLDMEKVPRGTPGSDRETVYDVYSSKKAEEELGVRFRSMGESMKDTLLSLREYGFH